MMKEWSQKSLLKSLVVATLAPTILLCLSVFFGLNNTVQQYQSTRNEIKGLETIRYLFHIATDLQKIRGLHQISSVKHSEAINQQLQTSRLHLDTDLEKHEWAELRAYFNINNEISDIYAREMDLVFPGSTGKHNNDIFYIYTDLINKVYNLIYDVANKSELTLDPEIESYHLMDISTGRLPELMESIAILRGMGGGLLAKGIITEDERDVFEINVATTQNIIKKINRSIMNTKSISSNLDIGIANERNSFVTHVASLLKKCKGFPCKPVTDITPESYFNNVSTILSGLDTFFTTSTHFLEVRLQDRLTRHFWSIALTVIFTLCAIAAISWITFYYYRQQLHAYQKMEHASFTDPLTDIPNRRLLDTEFAHAVQYAKREGKGLAFGLMDVDNFKMYNDSYGHSKGDVALKKIADALKSVLQRGGDFYYRYGGEEFCFFFHAESEDEVKKVVGKIHKAITDIGIAHVKNMPYGIITASIGTVFHSEIENTDIDFWIKNADNMLYFAKDNGRNRCEYMMTSKDSNGHIVKI
ncbi:MAG: GGDEF domain-containing protein, partial [Gammaproteobacteria bacterium]|nr:GGDEF domain-containing protein [Gammaproteobacteria bacterium]